RERRRSTRRTSPSLVLARSLRLSRRWASPLPQQSGIEAIPEPALGAIVPLHDERPVAADERIGRGRPLRIGQVRTVQAAARCARSREYFERTAALRAARDAVTAAAADEVHGRERTILQPLRRGVDARLPIRIDEVSAALVAHEQRAVRQERELAPERFRATGAP